jgi:hypothetical protein
VVSAAQSASRPIDLSAHGAAVGQRKYRGLAAVVPASPGNDISREAAASRSGLVNVVRTDHFSSAGARAI